MDWTHLALVRVQFPGSCEHGNEHPDSMKDGKLLD
jgi:hypothetical protein